jgi:hypothetical protein
VLLETLQNGRILEATTLLARGRQFNFPQLRDRALSPPDLPQGVDVAARVLANTSPW